MILRHHHNFIQIINFLTHVFTHFITLSSSILVSIGYKPARRITSAHDRAKFKWRALQHILLLISFLLLWHFRWGMRKGSRASQKNTKLGSHGLLLRERRKGERIKIGTYLVLQVWPCSKETSDFCALCFFLIHFRKFATPHHYSSLT